ncbi:Uncharacterised protein [Niallia circulans]|nr:Uncharacterised protein [Niallia circulans]
MKSFHFTPHPSPFPKIICKMKYILLLRRGELAMNEKEGSIYEYQNLLDMLAEMVTEYLTKHPKGGDSNDK